jgi:hypothetical protein
MLLEKEEEEENSFLIGYHAQVSEKIRKPTHEIALHYQYMQVKVCKICNDSICNGSICNTTFLLFYFILF